MKCNHPTRHWGAISASLLLALCLAWAAIPWAAAYGAPAVTFTVNATNDVDDGACNAAHCSLREAINAANAAAGSDTVAFNISGAGVKTISPTSDLPVITGPTIVDGLTQPGATCAAWPPTLLIVLSGAMAGPTTPGLQVAAGASTVRGLVVNGWSDYGISTAGNGNGSFSTLFPVAPGGFWLTATATDPAGNTSEFGPCRALGCYLDFNSNGRVDVQDIMQVAARWNNPGAYNAVYDVAEQWNSPCPSLER